MCSGLYCIPSAGESLNVLASLPANCPNLIWYGSVTSCVLCIHWFVLWIPQPGFNVKFLTLSSTFYEQFGLKKNLYRNDSVITKLKQPILQLTISQLTTEPELLLYRRRFGLGQIWRLWNSSIWLRNFLRGGTLNIYKGMSSCWPFTCVWREVLADYELQKLRDEVQVCSVISQQK